jgi:hypothetical protein
MTDSLVSRLDLSATLTDSDAVNSALSGVVYGYANHGTDLRPLRALVAAANLGEVDLTELNTTIKAAFDAALTADCLKAIEHQGLTAKVVARVSDHPRFLSAFIAGKISGLDWLNQLYAYQTRMEESKYV